MACPECGEGHLEAVYSMRGLTPKHFEDGAGVWKYSALLPTVKPRVTLNEGGTPLFRCSRVLEGSQVMVKDESRNPTSSFADRGSTVAVSIALELGAERIACASDGDTGASVAAYASKADLDCVVFAPSSAETGKLLQTLVYGAKLVRTPGTFRNSLARCSTACGSGCHNLTIETNPFAIEGEKTTAIEVVDQLGWNPPDFVVVPVGTGTNLYAIWKGYRELVESGLISHCPRMVAVQAEACSPIYEAYTTGEEIVDVIGGESIASSIAIGDPVNGALAVQALRQSNGIAYAVPDEEMVDAVNMLGRREGIFAEPSSAATISAARRLKEEGEADNSDVIVCIVTGSGLKVPDSIAKTLKPRLSAAWQLVSMEQKALGALGRAKIEMLEILGKSPNYGYGIWREMQQSYDDRMSLQAVYQHLDELQNMGLTDSAPSQRSQDRRRKYFKLTRRGEEILESIAGIRDSLLPVVDADSGST